MGEIEKLTAWLAALIPLAAAPRAIMWLLAMSADTEQVSTYKHKLKNLLLFVILAEAAMGLLGVVNHYLVGG